MFSMWMGSPSSFVMFRARLRALYLKQYLTPTMILPDALDERRELWKQDNQLRDKWAWVYVCQDGQARRAYQRFVKTTPKPKATKKRRGELEPLLLLLLLELFVLEGMAVCGLVTSDDVAVADCVVVVAALTTMWATSPRTWSMIAMADYLLQMKSDGRRQR